MNDEQQWLQKGFRRLAWHVEDSPHRLGYDHATGGKLPRNHVWRPYRFCVQDVLLGATVVRHAREHNCLEVDVFLTADVPQYEADSGARGLALFLLCEAFKCGGSMELRFTEHVEGGQVPTALQRIAAAYGMSFEHHHATQGRIDPRNARELFARLTGFSDDIYERVDLLSSQGSLSIERVCYAIQRGIWKLPEVESIVLGSPYPDLVLSGEIQPEQRHLYAHVLLHAQSALLGGLLDRKLALREHYDESGAAFDLEDDERNIIAEYEFAIGAKWYNCPDEMLLLPWSVGDVDPVEPNVNIVVLVRARDAIGLKRHLASDIALIGERALQSLGERYCVLVPFDFYDPLLSNERLNLEKQALDYHVHILVCPETMASLNVEARRRFTSSRIIRD